MSFHFIYFNYDHMFPSDAVKRAWSWQTNRYLCFNFMHCVKKKWLVFSTAPRNIGDSNGN